MADSTPARDRIVLAGDLSEGPAVPDFFREALLRHDPALLVNWNRIRRRFVIEQCIEHYAAGPEHTHLCRRQYVLTAQDEEGTMLPLNDRVLEMVKAADVSRAGYGPGDHARFCADMQFELEAHRADLERKQAEAIHYASRHNRRQVLKAVHLIQQHDLRPNR